MPYRVTLQADFIAKGNPETIRRKIHRLLKEQGWQDKNFEFGIEEIKKEKEVKDERDR